MNKLEQILHKHNRPITVIEHTVAPQCIRVLVSPQRRVLASGKPGAMTRLSHLQSLSKDIGIALGIKGVNVAEGESGIWIEVPRKDRELVRARDLEPEPWLSLPVTLGKDTSGKTLSLDLSDASSPHILVAGTTGSGKSILLHSIIRGLCANTNYMDTQIMIIDPHSRKNEAGTLRNNDGLGVWRESAHVYEIVRNLNSIDELLGGLVGLVEHRYENSFDTARYVLVIDELASIVPDTELGKCIKSKLAWLLANARKQGVHIIAATQYPSAELISGVVKANFPIRIAMKVTSSSDSRVILDQRGAEKLRGKGDGYLSDNGEIVRFQGAWVDDDDVQSMLRKAPSPQKKGAVLRKKVKRGPLGFWGQIKKFMGGK